MRTTDDPVQALRAAARVTALAALSLFAITAADYHQHLDFSTEIASTTTVDDGTYKRVVTESRSWPLTIDYAFNTVSDGYSAIC